MMRLWDLTFGYEVEHVVCVHSQKKTTRYCTYRRQRRGKLSRMLFAFQRKWVGNKRNTVFFPKVHYRLAVIQQPLFFQKPIIVSFLKLLTILFFQRKNAFGLVEPPSAFHRASTSQAACEALGSHARRFSDSTEESIELVQAGGGRWWQRIQKDSKSEAM